MKSYFPLFNSNSKNDDKSEHLIDAANLSKQKLEEFDKLIKLADYEGFKSTIGIFQHLENDIVVNTVCSNLPKYLSSIEDELNNNKTPDSLFLANVILKTLNEILSDIDKQKLFDLTKIPMETLSKKTKLPEKYLIGTIFALPPYNTLPDAFQVFLPLLIKVNQRQSQLYDNQVKAGKVPPTALDTSELIACVLPNILPSSADGVFGYNMSLVMSAFLAALIDAPVTDDLYTQIPT